MAQARFALGPLLMAMALLVTLLSPPADAAAASAPAAVPNPQMWQQRHAATKSPEFMAASEGAVFVADSVDAGKNADGWADSDLAVVAYDAADGRQLWQMRYDYARYPEVPKGIEVSADGTRVYVTASSIAGKFWRTPWHQPDNSDFVTLALNAVTGEVVWQQRYENVVDQPEFPRHEEPSDLQLSPDGRVVYVAGAAETPDNWRIKDYFVIAYDATTGAELWTFRNGDARSRHLAAMDVSADGGSLYLAGVVDSAPWPDEDLVVVAVDVVTSQQLWAVEHEDSHGYYAYEDKFIGIVANPSGNLVHVAGHGLNPNLTTDYLTLTFDAATGEKLWEQQFAQPWNTYEVPRGIEVAPAGDVVFVTGQSGTDRFYDIVTVAYDAATGLERWTHWYDSPAGKDDQPNGIAAHPGGRWLYLTGSSRGAETYSDYVTLALDTLTGRLVWEGRLEGPDDGDRALAIALPPSGRRVFVTGTEQPWEGRVGTTVAYCATPRVLVGSCMDAP